MAIQGYGTAAPRIGKVAGGAGLISKAMGGGTAKMQQRRPPVPRPAAGTRSTANPAQRRAMFAGMKSRGV